MQAGRAAGVTVAPYTAAWLGRLAGRGLLASAALAAAPAGSAAPPGLADRLHASAVGSFRQARFPEAYGRFVALADAGHAPASATAIWMCQHGLELFGKDWDCSGEHLQDWAALAGVSTPELRPRLYGRFVIGTEQPRNVSPGTARAGRQPTVSPPR